MKKIKHNLKEENYYQDKEYLNFSTLKIYRECPSKALAISEGKFNQEFSSDALLVGSYVDSAIEGTLEEFKSANKEIFKYKNPEKGKKQIIKDADFMIEKILNDAYAKKSLTGKKQEILVGEIEGVKVKCKIDNINYENKFFTDLKTCRDIYETMFDKATRTREHFIVARMYIHQLAFYREIIKQNTNENFEAFICTYDKTKDCRGLIVRIETELLDQALEEIKEMIQNHKLFKEKKIEPSRCEKCDYCEKTRKKARIFNSFEEFTTELY